MSSPADILIITGSVGSGHVSVARALAEAVEEVSGGRVKATPVDIITEIRSILGRATRGIYMNALKFAPALWEKLFEKSSQQQWPLKLLNALNSPFVKDRFLELFERLQPRVLVSTFPHLDLVIEEAWRSYCSARSKSRLPFVKVITDSISVHRAWIIAEPDFYVVGNSDTAMALRALGAGSEKIKIFGYPIISAFKKNIDRRAFEKRLKLSHKKTTLLLILSQGIRWRKIKKLLAQLMQLNSREVQLIIIAAGPKSWLKKLEEVNFPFTTYLTGWTNEMAAFIKSADIVLTKAGGSTVMEAIACGTPMIIIETIPGQEAGNAMLVSKYNLGQVLNADCSDLAEAMDYTQKYRVKIAKNFEQLQKPRAAQDAAKFLIGLI